MMIKFRITTNLALPIFLILVSASVSFGFGYFDAVTKGTPIPGLSPISAAMGSARALGVQEPACVFTNPAQTAGLAITGQASGAMISWVERVIESDLEKTTRTLNTYDNFTVAVTVPLDRFNFSAGFATVAEFGYEGSHALFDDPDDPLVGVAVLYADGKQYEAMAGVSANVTGPLSVGVSGGLRMADADYEYYFNSHTFGIPDSSSFWNTDASEFAWHAGLALNGDLFKSGASYSSETEYMEDVVAFGASAFAAHLNNITVAFEAEVISPFDNNRFMGKLSVVMPLRHNLNAITSVGFDDQRVANRAGLGFGLGFELDLDRLGLEGGLLSRFRARKNTAFPEETSDRIDDGASLFSFGVTYSLGD